MEFYNAYSGGQRELYTSEALFEYLGGKPVRAIINDAAAQTIAAWWHSPRWACC